MSLMTDKICDQHIRDDDNSYKELEFDRNSVIYALGAYLEASYRHGKVVVCLSVFE